MSEGEREREREREGEREGEGLAECVMTDCHDAPSRMSSAAGKHPSAKPVDWNDKKCLVAGVGAGGGCISKCP